MRDSGLTMIEQSVIVFDFETTGLSPDQGDRAIEIGAVLLQNNEIVDRFSSLMNPGMMISSFIEEYTSITNEMLEDAPSIPEVMGEFASFMADHPLVAHNASFDKRFLDAELLRIQRQCTQEIACSMLVSRRIYPEAPNHRLGTLVEYKSLKTDGVYHRALADAEMTAHLWVGMIDDIRENSKLSDVPFELMRRLSKVKKSSAHAFLEGVAGEQIDKGTNN